MRTALLAFIGTMLLVESQASAGNCARVSVGYQANYVQPVYVQPAVTIIDPYNQLGYVNVVAKAFLVQQNPLVPLQSYTSVGDDARQYYSQKQAIRDGFKEALLELQQQALQAPNPASTGSPAPPLAVPNNAKPWSQVMLNTFKTTCTRCHNPIENPERLNLSASTDLNAVDQRFYKDLPEQRQDILFRIMASPQSPEFMPKQGTQDPEFVDAAWASVAVAKAEARAKAKKPANIPAVPNPHEVPVPKPPTEKDKK